MTHIRRNPTPASIRAFVVALTSHSQVLAVDHDGYSQRLVATLKNGVRLQMYLTDLYVVGEADVIEITSLFPEINCIVTLSSWNDVSADAATYGGDRRIGVFTWKGVFGAINYRKFWFYYEIPYNASPAEVAREKARRRREWN